MLRIQYALILTLGLGLTGCMDPSESGHLVPQTAAEDGDIPQMSFNGSTFHVETYGQPGAPVIVMLHGGPGSDFRSLLRLLVPVDGRRLGEDHHLIFWDQRGSCLLYTSDAADDLLQV